MYATSLGKALLAYADAEAVRENLRVPFRRFTPYTQITPAQFLRSLERVREEGIATDHEEFRMGVNCIAAPILDVRTGRVNAAISICSTNSSVEQRYRRVLLRMADERSRHCHGAA